MKKIYGCMIKGALIASLLVPCLPITTVTYAKEQDLVNPAHLESYSIQVNRGEKQQKIQTQGFIQDGVMMIAARDLFDAIGFNIKGPIGWRAKYKVEAQEVVPRTIFNKFTFEEHNDSIKLLIDIEEEEEEDIAEQINMPTYTTVINGRLYIPFEFIAAILNYDVTYDHANNTIIITPWENKDEQVKQIEDFVHHYMSNVSEGYSSDLSLYTTAFLEHDEEMIDTAFSDEQWPEPYLKLKDWTIRYLFLPSHDEAVVKIPYLAVGKVSKSVGGMWLHLIRTDQGWKVDTSTDWNQSVYIDGIKEQIHNLKLNEPEQVKAIKRGVYAKFNVENTKKETADGARLEYKTFPKNIKVLYADDQIAYVSTEYNWSFQPTDENMDKYHIISNEDFITMKKNSNGQWSFKSQYGLPLDYNMPTSSIRGNYANLKYTFFAFDSYYWDSHASIN